MDRESQTAVAQPLVVDASGRMQIGGESQSHVTVEADDSLVVTGAIDGRFVRIEPVGPRKLEPDVPVRALEPSHPSSSCIMTTDVQAYDTSAPGAGFWLQTSVAADVRSLANHVRIVDARTNAPVPMRITAVAARNVSRSWALAKETPVFSYYAWSYVVRPVNVLPAGFYRYTIEPGIRPLRPFGASIDRTCGFVYYRGEADGNGDLERRPDANPTGC